MLQQFIIVSNFCFISQRARKLDKFGGKMTKFEDIGVDLNKVKVKLPWGWSNLLLLAAKLCCYFCLWLAKV